MKKILFPLLAAVLVTATSCESCDKKTDAGASAYDETAPATQVQSDTIVTTDISSDASATTNATTTRNATRAAGQSSQSQSPVKSGYSAPDGTDAENSDGDQYTRNDATPKPTGPPIK